MVKPVKANAGTLATAGQVHVELATAERLIDDVTRALRDLGNAGVTDAETAMELERHLKASLAAAYRWHTESRINAAFLMKNPTPR